MHGESQQREPSAGTVRLRQARLEDIAQMHRVRLAVRENVLMSTITESDYVSAIEVTGRGWVVEVDDVIVAFAVGDAHSGSIWALFVAPEHERRGYGRWLHAEMTSWLFDRGLTTLWLTTDRGTRAQNFYEAAGWKFTGVDPNGEARYQLSRSDMQRLPPNR